MPDSLWPHGLYSPWNSSGQNTGVGNLSLLQGFFTTQGSNPHCKQILYQLIHKGSPRLLEWVAYPCSSGSSQPRNQTGASCISGGFFTNWAMREIQSIHRDIAGSIPDHHNRANLAAEWVIRIYWLPSVYESFVYTLL